MHGSTGRPNRAGEVTTVTLDSPASRNALSRALLAQLREALADALGDPGCRVVVLTGADPAFCAGADLKESRTGAAAAPELFPQILQLIWDSQQAGHLPGERQRPGGRHRPDRRL